MASTCLIRQTPSRAIVSRNLGNYFRVLPTLPWDKLRKGLNTSPYFTLTGISQYYPKFLNGTELPHHFMGLFFYGSIERSSWSTEHRKTKVLLWLNTKDRDNPVNQSKVKANTRGWREARENVRERVTIGFSPLFLLFLFLFFCEKPARRLSTLIYHEGGAFRKRSSNRRDLNTLTLHFSVDGKQFDNGVTTIMWFP